MPAREALGREDAHRGRVFRIAYRWRSASTSSRLLVFSTSQVRDVREVREPPSLWSAFAPGQTPVTWAKPVALA